MLLIPCCLFAQRLLGVVLDAGHTSIVQPAAQQRMLRAASMVQSAAADLGAPGKAIAGKCSDQTLQHGILDGVKAAVDAAGVLVTCAKVTAATISAGKCVDLLWSAVSNLNGHVDKVVRRACGDCGRHVQAAQRSFRLTVTI